MTIRVRLTPRGGRDRIEGWVDDPERQGARLLKVRVAAPPVDGAANKAMLALLARTLGVARSAIEITAGRESRIKSLKISGIGVQALINL